MTDNIIQGPESWRQNAGKSLVEEPAADPIPIDPGGRGPHDPGMEARIAVLEEIAASVKASLGKLEAGQDQLREAMRLGFESARDRHDRDFRITFGAIIAVALGLAGLVAKGFKWF